MRGTCTLVTVAILAACGGGGGSSQGGGNATGGTSGTGATPTPSPSATPSPTATPAPTPTPSGSTSSVQDDMLAVVLARHNQARTEVGVSPLTLDSELSRQALAYAKQLADTGTFQHSAGADRPGQGENLWAGTANRFSYEQMANGWINEKQYFIYDRFPYNSTTGNWADVGHFTQIIWKNTTRLGCGLATGNNRDVLVCRYAPQGNIVGQYPY